MVFPLPSYVAASDCLIGALFSQLRVDGVLMRLRDTRMHCIFGESNKPVVLRECCWREATFQALASVSYYKNLKCVFMVVVF